MAYERSESPLDNFGKFICQLQPKIKKLVRKLQRILIKLYWQNGSLSFNQIYIWFVNKLLVGNIIFKRAKAHLLAHSYITQIVLLNTVKQS